MAKILGTTIMTGNISKMTETPDYFLINGAVYDKGTLAPLPFDFCPISSSVLNEMNLYQTAYVGGWWNRNRTTNGYVIDNTDPSTCYTLSQGSFGTTSSATITKLTKGANGWTTLYNAGWGCSYSPFLNIIGQDNQKVYYTMNRIVDGSYTYIGNYNKNTLASTSISLGNKGIVKILKDTDMYFYFACYSVSALSYSVGKYDKVNNTVSWIMNDTLLTGNPSNSEASNMSTNGVFYAVRDGMGLGMSDHYVAFRKYKLDTAMDTVATSNVVIDYSLLPAGKVLINTNPSTNGLIHTLLDYTDTNTGKKYVTHLMSNGGSNALYINALDSAMYTYEIIDENNWKLVSWTNFNPIVYKTFLPVLNNQTIMLANENGCHIYSWDTGSTSYKKVSSFDAPVTSVGIDSNNNLYIQYADTSVEMISNVMPVTLFADFEADFYNYNGTDITTNIVAYIKNYQGKYLSSSMQINLYGNCKFTDDGSRVKTVTTSNLDKLTLPVTIYDTGRLNVTVKAL